MKWLASFVGGPGTIMLHNWKWLVMGVLLTWGSIQTVRLAWLQTSFERITAKVKVMDAMTKQIDAQYRLTENTWRVNVVQIKKERDDELKSLTAERDDALAELRNRPHRPAPSTAENTTAGKEAQPGCTGAQLYQDDAGFLIREAADADAIKIELKSCYAQYNNLLK